MEEQNLQEIRLMEDAEGGIWLQVPNGAICLNNMKNNIARQAFVLWATGEINRMHNEKEDAKYLKEPKSKFMEEWENICRIMDFDCEENPDPIYGVVSRLVHLIDKMDKRRYAIE